MIPAHPIAARWMRGFFVCIVSALSAHAPAAQEPPRATDPEAAVRLGKRLFHDLRLSNPGAHFDASCRSCHIPKGSPEAKRNYTDVLPRSLLPSSARGSKLTALRNTPTLIGASKAKRFYWDGRYASLEDAIKGELASTHLGWLPDESGYAYDEVANMIVWDTGDQANAVRSYGEAFGRAYEADVEAMGRDEAVDLVVRALAAFIRTLDWERTTPYDVFRARNSLPEGPDPGESNEDFAARVVQELALREADETLQFAEGFDRQELEGMKRFFRRDPANTSVNCVSCHVPPRFTDNAFHNTGVSREAYDRLHGPGTFAAIETRLDRRPAASLMKPPTQDDPARADLGYWNHADSEVAESYVGAFRTPSLRELVLSDPYMHNGAYESIEEVIAQKQRASGNAITDADIPLLAAFLRSLTSIEPSSPE